MIQILFSLANLYVFVSLVPTASFRAVAEIVSGDSRIFSGESVRLKCSVPDIRSTWDFMWFRGSEQLPQTGETFSLWKANVKESGKFYCQGVRNTVVGKIHTLQSLPLEINVDGKIFVCLFSSIIRNLLDSHVRTDSPSFSYFCYS